MSITADRPSVERDAAPLSRTRPRAWPRQIWGAPWVLGLASLAVFLVCRAQVVSGDAAVYASTILRGNLGERSIHIGYYALGWVAGALLAPFGVPLDQALVVFGAVCGAAAVVACAYLLRELDSDRRTALIAAAVFAFAGNVLDQSTHAEVYTLQIALLTTSWLLWLRGRAAPAGALFGAALLVTPLSIMGIGPFVWRGARRDRIGPLAIAMGAAAVVWLGAIAPFAQDYFFGTRGLLNVGPDREFSVGNLAYNVYSLGKSFTWLLPFALVGWVVELRRARSTALLLALVVFFHLPVLLGMRESGVFALPIYPFVALAIAHGVIWIVSAVPRGASRVVLAGALAGLYATSALYVWYERPSTAYRDSLVAFLRHCPPGATLVAPWHDAVSLELYASLYATDVRVRPRVVQQHDLTAQTLREAVAGHSDVFVLETWRPGRGSRAVLSSGELERRRETYSIVAQVERLAPELEARTVSLPGVGIPLYRVVPA